MGGAVIPDAADTPSPIVFVVPRSSVTVIDDWGGENAMGMQGSGSNSVRVHEVFVADRCIAPSPMARLSTEGLPDGTPGTRLVQLPPPEKKKKTAPAV